MKRPWHGSGRADSPKKRKPVSPNGVGKRPRQKNELNLVEDHVDEITQIVRANEVTVIMGCPRQGKSSFLPCLLHCLFGRTGKSVAAVHISAFQAKRCSIIVKEDPDKRDITGYKTEFENEMDNNTKIRFMTSDCFLNEFAEDTGLSRYCAILVDDFHLRTWQTELAIYFLRHCLRARRESGKILPKLVFVGCPIDPRWLMNFFHDFVGQTVLLPQSGIKESETLQLVSSGDMQRDIVRLTLLSLFSVIDVYPDGDIICYLPGPAEIHRAAVVCWNWLSGISRQSDFRVIALTEEEPQVVQSQERKIIFTDEVVDNIPIPDICVVIDSGLVRVSEAMTTNFSVSVNRWRPVSRLEATIRERRLSRTRRGTFIRLYNLQSWTAGPDPRIYASDLCDLLLRLHWCCVESTPSLPSQVRPSDNLLQSAKSSLHLIGAFNCADFISYNPSNLTRIGWQMTSLPLGWRDARAVLAAAELGCLAEVLTVMAMLHAGSIFAGGRKDMRKIAEAAIHFRTPEGDAVSLLRVYREYRRAADRNERNWCQQHNVSRAALRRAISLRRRLREVCIEQELPIRSCGDDLRAVNLALLHGYVGHLARHNRIMLNGEVRHRYRLVANAEEVELPMDSALYSPRPPELLFHLGLEAPPDQVPVMRRACPSDLATVRRCFPGLRHALPDDN